MAKDSPKISCQVSSKLIRHYMSGCAGNEGARRPGESSNIEFNKTKEDI